MIITPKLKSIEKEDEILQKSSKEDEEELDSDADAATDKPKTTVKDTPIADFDDCRFYTTYVILKLQLAST